MKYSYHKIISYILVLLVGLVIGYFAGREHLKYEMRSAVQSAAEEIQKGFSSAFNINSPFSREGIKEKVPPKSTEKEPISIVLIKKEIIDWKNSGNYVTAIGFSVSVKNLTNKDIRAFDGDLTFTDLLNNKILTTNLSIDVPVKVGETIVWGGQMTYSPLLHSMQQLHNTAQENLKVIFITNKMLFVDGTTNGFVP